MKITSIEKSVQKLLGSEFFTIPRFQRPYSWQNEHLDEFWSDTVEDNDAADYFIGAIVGYPRGNAVAIVDGQQRLTTATILLACLRNALKALGEAALAGGIQRFIVRQDLNNELQYVIETQTSYPYFQKHIQDEAAPQLVTPPGTEERLLAAAFEFFSEKINEAVAAINSDVSLSQKRKKIKTRETLIRIRDQILSLSTVYIEVGSEDDAVTIFETLNTRGEELGISDLAKTHLARLIKKSKSVDDVRDAWKKIVATLESPMQAIPFDGFLHHWWLSKYPYTSSKKLFSTFRKTVTKQLAPQVLDSLVEDAKRYAAILVPGSRSWSKSERAIKGSLEALQVFKLRQPLPFVLSLLRAYDEGKITVKLTKEALRTLENFHFVSSAVVAQRSSGGVSKMYATLARELDRATTTNGRGKVIQQLRAKLSVRRPTEEQFRAGFAEITHSESEAKRRSLVRYILGKIAEYHASAGALDTSAITIEHIASQSAGEFVRRNEIGNLVGVGETLNSELDSKPPAQKLKILQKKLPWLDESLQKGSEWSDEKIESRTAKLAAIAYKKVWAF